MPVSDDYAKRTACRDHSKIYSKELRGSMRWTFLSECEGRHLSHGYCKFSHTIFNTARILKLGGENQNFVVKLDYGYGFERYGSYEGWDKGWDCTVDQRSLRSGGSMQSTHSIPESLLLAEHKSGIKAKGDPEVTYAKVQSICRAHYDHSNCRRVDCRYDHDLVDGERIERLVRWGKDGMIGDHPDYLTLECRVTGGHVMWKITMKPAAFETLSQTNPLALTIPARPFSHEDEDLLKVIRHMESIVGLTQS